MAASFHSINGINFPSFIEHRKVDELTDFPLKSDDLFVVTYPKSGTVWSLFLVNTIRSLAGVGGDAKPSVLWLEREGKEATSVSYS